MEPNALKTERFVFFQRTPPDGLRYIRAMFAPPNTRPHTLARAVAHKSIFGWTLTSTGVCVRFLYVSCQSGPDGNPDGCGDYFSDNVKDAEAGTWLGVGKALGPMRPENSSPGLMADERLARRPDAEHWILYFERQATRERELRKAEAEAAAKAESEAKAEAELAAKAILFTPPPKPKGFIDRLLGRE